MRSFGLLLAAIALAGADVCPQGYSADGSGKCLDLNWQDGPRFEAYDRCAKKNGVLFDIKNAFENTAVQGMASNETTQIWLGLTCLSNDVSSCVWDTGRALDSQSYSNFMSSSPNAQVGACVVMDTLSGKWVSADCTQILASSACQFVQNVTVGYCPDGSVFFREKCYMNVLVYDYEKGKSLCEINCGKVASIHSDGENSLVRDVAALIDGNGFPFIGLTFTGRNNNYKWDDATPVNYKNFGYENRQVGNCVTMSVGKGFLKPGAWVNAPCSSAAPVNIICERDVETRCNQKLPTVITTPPVCTSPFVLNGTGTIYSHPDAAEATTCQFLITEADNKAAITFNEVSLENGSKIELYSGFAQNSRFATLTNSSSSSQNFTAPGNILGVVFTKNQDSDSYFIAGYSDSSRQIMSQPRICGGGDFFDQGTIKSPNYPRNYTSNLACTYRLHSSKNRIVIDFLDFLTETSYDYVIVRDFSGVQLAVISGGPMTNYTISSLSSMVTVEFHTDEDKNLRGFQANFYSIY